MRAADDITGKDERLTHKVPLGMCIYRPSSRARVWARGLRGSLVRFYWTSGEEPLVRGCRRTGKQNSDFAV